MIRRLEAAIAARNRRPTMTNARKTVLLLYHDFFASGEAAKDNFAVAREDFAAQMKYLSDHGFEGVSLERLAADPVSSKREDRLDADARAKIVLTLDDDDISHYDFVLPVLRRERFTATFFITVNDVGAARQMDWTMIRELAAGGMEIGSHGLVHAVLPARDDRTLLDEMVASRRTLEERTGKRVAALSVPHGFYDRRVMAAARKAGYSAVCVSDAGYNDFSGPAPFVLKRFTMRTGYDIRSFRSIVEGRPAASIAAAERLRAALRAFLGYRMYDRFRRLKYGAKEARGG
jgi:peptidoglycan/xylan/chitin deacetylase (PgdA/CDA1 family)